MFSVPQTNMDILMNELTIRGFSVLTFAKEFQTAWNEMVPLVKTVSTIKLMYFV